MTRRVLDVACIGSGIGGLSAAIALRRQGESVCLLFALFLSRFRAGSGLRQQSMGKKAERGRIGGGGWQGGNGKGRNERHSVGVQCIRKTHSSQTPPYLSINPPFSHTGHRVSLYERYDFTGEVGASLSCAKNGTMWLEEWKVRHCKGGGTGIESRRRSPTALPQRIHNPSHLDNDRLFWSTRVEKGREAGTRSFFYSY